MRSCEADHSSLRGALAVQRPTCAWLISNSQARTWFTIAVIEPPFMICDYPSLREILQISIQHTAVQNCWKARIRDAEPWPRPPFRFNPRCFPHWVALRPLGLQPTRPTRQFMRCIRNGTNRAPTMRKLNNPLDGGGARVRRSTDFRTREDPGIFFLFFAPLEAASHPPRGRYYYHPGNMILHGQRLAGSSSAEPTNFPCNSQWKETPTLLTEVHDEPIASRRLWIPAQINRCDWRSPTAPLKLSPGPCGSCSPDRKLRTIRVRGA